MGRDLVPVHGGLDDLVDRTVPLARRNNHALACNRVVRVSYEIRISAPRSASQSSAR